MIGDEPAGLISATRPRVLISAASSGSGKTTVVCGLLRCLTRQGLDVISYKCGPDYIDPMFHRTVIGTPCRNLDLFFSSEDEVRTLLAESSTDHDIAVLEGVMGFYDGLGGRDTQASAYHLATATDTPVLLVVDGRGTSLTLAATVKGIMDFRPSSHIAGIVINHCSKSTHRLLAPILERECGLDVVGYVEDDPAIALQSRHLGLVTAREVDGLNVVIDRIADMFESTFDLDRIVEIARATTPIPFTPHEVGLASVTQPVIAVADDEAFCFYYEENLEMFRRLGASLVFFSPIADDALPAEADAVYLGGGYPELHAKELSANTTMLESIRLAHEVGMPMFAECGGFLYLKERLEDMDGHSYPLVGVLPGAARSTGRLTRFGYIEMTARRSGLAMREGDTIRAHEFHYYDSDDNGTAFSAVKPLTGRSWECGVIEENLLAGFPHLYLPACPRLARRFVNAATRFQARRM